MWSINIIVYQQNLVQLQKGYKIKYFYILTWQEAVPANINFSFKCCNAENLIRIYLGNK